MKLKFLLITLLSPCVVFAHTDSVQKKPIKISTALIKQLKSLKPDSSNAYEVEQQLGKPAACLPLPPSKEAWICQWKADLTSSGLMNTINIMFESGMLTKVIAIDKNGKQT